MLCITVLADRKLMGLIEYTLVWKNVYPFAL